jgi:hypothetical protein
VADETYRRLVAEVDEQLQALSDTPEKPDEGDEIQGKS